jgi:hypothetical protein
MAHPFHHALSSAKKWGGGPEEYLLLHQYMDQSKAAEADFRHRAALHHSLGIFMLEQHFGPVIQISTGRTVPVRFIGEQHVVEDLGRIPTLAVTVSLPTAPPNSAARARRTRRVLVPDR